MTDQTNVAESYNFTEGFEFGGLVDQSYFGYDDKYGEKPILVLELDPLTGEGEVRRQFFSFGDGWEISDDGRNIIHVSKDPNKRLNAGSNLAKLVASAASLPGVAQIFQSRGPATFAGIWDGLAFDFTTVTKENTWRNGEVRKSSTTLCTSFYPDLSRITLDGGAPARDEIEDAIAVGEYGLPEGLESDLKHLATVSSSHGEFHQRALAEISGVEGNPAAEALVSDPAFYNEAGA